MNGNSPEKVKDNRNDEISIIEIAALLWNHKWLIAAFAVIGMVLAFIQINYFTADVYLASGTLYVSSSSDSYENIGTINKSVIDTARTMSTTCIEILKTRSFLSDVSESIGGKYSWTQLRQMVSVAAINETELLSVTASAYSAEDAFLIAQAIINNAQEKLTDVFKSGSIAIVDNAAMPELPVNNGLKKRMVMYGGVGIVLACGIIFLINMFDTTVHKSEDVIRRYQVSVLGEIAN